MALIQFIFSKRFLKNVLYALLLVVLLPAIIYIYLNWYTGHGTHVTVPDVRGLVATEAGAALEDAELSFVVIDSVYSEEGQPGAVFEQSPQPFAEVKSDRAVYLTVYRSTPPAETIKIAEGMNERVAEIILQNKGIKFGKQYEEHVYLAGMVVRVLHNGQVLTPESQIERGSKVTLVIGRRSDEKVAIPQLVGLSIDSASAALVRSRLVLGMQLFDAEIVTASDSAAARIYRQSPIAGTDRTILVGSPIDVFVGFKSPVLDEPTDELDQIDVEE
jgi:beta-lactam-binding protein with PASTA domain